MTPATSSPADTPVGSGTAPERIVPTIGPVDAPDLHLMTYNVRRRMPQVLTTRHALADRWSTRLPALRLLLGAERPSVLGIQEALPDQSAQLADALGEDYASVGTGRDRDRGGERIELYVDTTRLRIVRHDALWLSATPGVPGSRSYGNMIPRTAVHVELEDLAAGGRLHVVVTHFDHLSARSRLHSAVQLRTYTDALDGPVALMGDFNAGVGSPAHRELTRGRLVDSREIADERLDPGWGSFSNYGPPRTGGRRLDWLLVDGDAHVDRAGVGGIRPGGIAPSDHDPVHAVVRWASGQDHVHDEHRPQEP
ncbi:endonuclease/exonuclease/phosphatase family protein [Frigoribacterium sp. VKM Ac-2836]|uniref:endonuclease/exonuclease/phosphatase family protein n=1 Tax=Frigoribacterium sp. VKM Ac-2836 TaxID=2739014 RepID=UPI0015677B8C|nr:endonuclease/exonuclease/phosphatase family protein [Frigoribacterium sp. VKM Ac-2836]NRD25027.1 endonuclease/exonuclease/phosphatase family protein [Frigoribacterium sp. VKM Ac-2836]